MKTGFIKGNNNGIYEVFGAFFQSKPRKSGQIWQIEMKMPKMESSRPVDSLKKKPRRKFFNIHGDIWKIKDDFLRKIILGIFGNFQ